MMVLITIKVNDSNLEKKNNHSHENSDNINNDSNYNNK